MKQRCYNSRTPLFRYYGAKGVAVSDRWRTDFSAFAVDMGPKPSPRHSIDRIDVTGNYTPENCRWALPKVQNRNQRWTRHVALDGRRVKAVELAEIAGVKTDTIMARAGRGLDAEAVLSSGTTRNRDEWRASVWAANVASATSKRGATHCQRGHAFSAENTQITREGRRRCRACTALRANKYRSNANHTGHVAGLRAKEAGT